MLESAINQISKILDGFLGVNSLEIVDTESVRLHFQDPKTDKRVFRNFQCDEGGNISVELLEFMEKNFVQK